MTFSIDHTLTFSTTPETVWEVITDLKRYGEWNPFVVACESTLEESSPINMRVRVCPFFSMPQQETIFEHIPRHKLSYGMSMPFGALSSCREHVVIPLDASHTEYQSHFTVTGWLSPLVEWLLKKQLQRGFTDMSTGIEARLISIAQRRETQSKNMAN